MKLTIGNGEDLLRLVEWYNKGIINADEYFEAVDAWSTVVIRKELAEAQRRRDNER